MMESAFVNKKASRMRRAAKTRAKISELHIPRLTIHRTNCHIYAQVISECGTRVLAAASTLEAALRSQVSSGGNVEAAKLVGMLIGQRAVSRGIEKIAFDRSGFKYHGRVQALAEAARDAGLKF